nr:hypothetical protein [Tanacetum cinerariifolium]
MSFGDEPVYDSNPNSYNQTPDFSNLPPHHNYEIDSRSNTRAVFQEEFAKFQQNFKRFIAQLRCSNCGGLFNGGNCPSCSIEESVTFSNPLLNSNDDFISSDNESLSDKDIPKDNVKIYSNPLFQFDDEYISSDVNPLFDKVLEDIECKDSYDPNLDESTFLVTPLFDSNEDEYFTPGDDVELLLHHDPSIPKMSVTSILKGFTDEPPLEENDDLFDLESKNDEWKKILYDAQIDDLIFEDKFFISEIV